MSLLRSFKYAFLGIGRCFENERNMRIHLVLALYTLYFSAYYDFTRVQYAVLCAFFALVFFAEMVNTAIEELVDINSEGFNFKAKAAKDIAAGAVLICAIFAIIAGFLFFFDTEIIRTIFFDTLTHPVKLVGFILSVVLAVLFIRFGLHRKKI
ncbi:MAG: diacylglycerol kinase family protein [Clostridia bacterium]|nr:diacylglycerol kinase family protein [Clostridia bacterium]